MLVLEVVMERDLRRSRWRMELPAAAKRECASVGWKARDGITTSLAWLSGRRAIVRNDVRSVKHRLPSCEGEARKMGNG